MTQSQVGRRLARPITHEYDGVKKCAHCKRGLLVTRYDKWQDAEGEAISVPSREIRQVVITHRRDFHHRDRYVDEEWRAFICAECLPKIVAFVGPMHHWQD